MRSIAFLTAACMFEGHPDQRADHWEHDLEYPPLRDACAGRGIALREVIWDDPALDPDAFDAFVIGTTWDYTDRPAEFVAALERIAARRPLFNPLSTVRWNLDKSYLRDLADRGAPVVPTLFCARADAPTIAEAFDALGADEVVAKPAVGASAWRQARIARGAPLPPPEEMPPGATLIQPFLPAASEEGEYSFIFFDRVFSHGVRKIPKAGDYRVQSLYGGHERDHAPAPEELATARRVLDAVEGTLLYARVDMMRGLDGELAVMELEMVEPYYYPEQAGDGMGERFADALERVLAR